MRNCIALITIVIAVFSADISSLPVCYSSFRSKSMAYSFAVVPQRKWQKTLINWNQIKSNQSIYHVADINQTDKTTKSQSNDHSMTMIYL